MHWLYIYSGHPCAQLHLQDQMAHTSPPCKDMNTELFLEKGVPCIFFFCLLLHIFCPLFFFTFQILYQPRAPTVCLCVASTCSGHGTRSYYGIVMIPVLKTLSRKRKAFQVIGQSLCCIPAIFSYLQLKMIIIILKKHLRYSCTSPFITKYISYDSQPFCFTFPQKLYQILGAYGTICMINYYKLNMQKSLYFKMKVQ